MFGQLLPFDACTVLLPKSDNYRADILAIYKPDNDSADIPTIYNQTTIVPIYIQFTMDQPIVPIRLRSTDQLID